MNEIDTNNWNVTKAAREFRIPRQTLQDRVSEKYDTNQVGRKCELTEEEENTLVNYFKYMGSIGKPMSVSAAKIFAWTIVKRSKRPTRFNVDKGPGHTW